MNQTHVYEIRFFINHTLNHIKNINYVDRPYRQKKFKFIIIVLNREMVDCLDETIKCLNDALCIDYICLTDDRYRGMVELVVKYPHVHQYNFREVVYDVLDSIRFESIPFGLLSNDEYDQMIELMDYLHVKHSYFSIV
jgi:hypothetical protein